MTKLPAPRLKKTEWPKFIADALGIPAVMGSGGPWVATGDTTDRVWFDRVAEALGVPAVPGNRDTVMERLVEAVGETWDDEECSSRNTESGGQGNVKPEAFKRLWLGMQHSRRGDNALLQAEAMTEVLDPDGHPDVESEKKYALRLIRQRLGQPKFRTDLLAAYGNRCAISGSDITETLEAAHIKPFAAGGPMETNNGLLLRADLHNLFDLGLMTIEWGTWRILLDERIRASDAGRQLAEATFSPPKPSAEPNREYLEEHRRATAL